MFNQMFATCIHWNLIGTSLELRRKIVMFL